MPELPEVESARVVIAEWVLGQRVAAIEDVDSYVCRPHTAAEFETALIGRRIERVNRPGKLIWCQTSPLRGATLAGPASRVPSGHGRPDRSDRPQRRRRAGR